MTADLKKYPESSCRFGNTVFREGFIVTEGVDSRVQEGCDIYTLAVIDEEPGMVLQEVAQVIFFFRGSLHLDVLPICKDYPPAFEAWDCLDAEDCSDLPAIAYTLAGLEKQSCRLNYWDIEMRDIDVENIFAILRPGVDIDRITKEDKWRRWARILAMQLVDDIYVFHFAQSPSPILDNHIIARFGAASTRDVLQDMLHASEVLGIKRGPVPVKIAGYSHPVHISPSASHFADINLLGNDFITAYNVALGPNRNEGTVQLFFNWGSKWETSPKL